jgi:integrase
MKGSLKQYNDTTWHYVVNFDPVLVDGKKKYPQKKYTVKAIDQDDAELKALGILKKLKLGDFEIGEDPTVEEWINTWLEDGKKEWAKQTYTWYEQKCRLHIIPKLGLTRLSKLKKRQIKELFEEKEETSPHLPHQLYRTLKAALQQAVYSDEVDYQYNIMMSVEPPEKPDIEQVIWNERQIRMFLTRARKDDFLVYSMCSTLFITCARFNEVAGLTWDCLDSKKKLLTFYRKLELKLDNGEPDFGRLKNKKQHKLIKIPDELVKLLKEVRKEQEKEIGAAGDCYKKYNFIFAAPDGSRIQIDHFRRRFEKVIDDENIELANAKPRTEERIPRIKLHSIRHSGATFLLDSKIPIETVREILDHSTLEMTKHYIHDNAERQKPAIKKTAGLLKTL